MRKVLGVTGIRSEYDLMSPVYQAIQAHPELELSLVVTGAHCSSHFGLTIERIREDGFDIAEVIESLIDGDSDVSRLKGAAVQLMGLVQTISRLRPDFLLILGDREETLSTALCGTYLNIPIVHVAGGDRVIGNADDQIRHAVSKLAHLHFATSEESADRLIRMGEQSFRVFFSGNPGIDRLARTEMLDKRALLTYYGFDPETEEQPLLLVVQHVISTEIEQAYFQMKTTLEAIKAMGFNTVLSYPNSDAGSRELIRCIEEYTNLPNLKIHRFIPRIPFVNTLRHASALVGNSSLGLLEAPFFHLPAINIGNRQKARFHAGNVQFVSHDSEEIERAVNKAVFDPEYLKYIKTLPCPFGEGHAATKIAEVLAKIPYDEALKIKDITY